MSERWWTTRRQLLRIGGGAMAGSLLSNTAIWPVRPQSGEARSQFGDVDTSTDHPLTDTGLSDAIDRQWRFETDAKVYSSPAVVDGTVYFGSRDSTVYALNASNGTEQWSFQTGDEVFSSPAVVDGSVYIGSFDTNVYALDASDGTEQWHFETGRIVESSPVVVDGTVYIGSRDTNVYALDAADGTEQWRFETRGLFLSSPAVANDTVYIGNYDSNVYAVDATNGTEQWSYQTGEAIAYSSPAVVDGSVYVGSNDGNVYALDTSDGTEQWVFQTGGEVFSSPGVADGIVYFGNRDGTLYALDANDGTEKWRFETDDEVSSSPTVVDSTVYIGGFDTYIYALDAENGTEQWRFDTDGEVFSSPAVVDGTVYVGSGDGGVYALTGTSGGGEQDGDPGDNTENPPDREGFNPAVHGFGFENYDTPAPPEWTDLFNIVGDFVGELQDREVFDPNVGPLKRLALTGLIYSGFKGGWTNGHCLGMVLTAREYYETGLQKLPRYTPDVNEDERPLPLAVPPETAADITEKPRTKPELDPIEADIDSHQHTQAFDSSYALRYIATAAVENNDLDLINYQAVIEAVQEQLSNGVPALLGLIDTIKSGHAVLAYDIELENRGEPVQSVTDAARVDVSVYDPNSSAVNYYDRNPYFITFSRPSTQDEFQMATYSRGDLEYSEAMFVEEVDPDYEFFAGEDLVDAYATALSAGLNDYLSVGVMSPVTVEITGPGETTLRRLDVDPEQLQAETEYETIYFAMDIDPGEYDIEIQGTDTGEYTIEVEGETTDGSTIADSYTGRITEGETQNLTVMLPSESDQVGQLRADDPSTDTGTDDGSLLLGFSETELAAGGVASVAMVYAAFRMLSDDDSDDL